MCVIIYIPKGRTFPESMLEIAVWNNPHGFGLCTFKGKKLEVLKELPENGTDPKYIQKLLDDRIKHDRFLHLRWKTEGEISEDNVQPFLIYKSEGDEAWFMHNGTLHDYKPIDLPELKDTRSDSRIFAETVLTPLLDDTDGVYSTNIMKKTINKFWGISSSSKGLIISNYGPVQFINNSGWKKLKVTGQDGASIEEFDVSNEDYFTQLKRGYEYERREAHRKFLLEEHRKKKEAEAAANSVSPNPGNAGHNVAMWPLSKIASLSFAPNQRIDENELASIMGDEKLWTNEGLALLSALCLDEIEDLVRKHPEIFASLFEYMGNCFVQIHQDYEKVLKKHEDATKLIATLKNSTRTSGGGGGSGIILPDDYDQYGLGYEVDKVG